MTNERRFPCATPDCPAERMVYTAGGREPAFTVYPDILPGPPDMLCVWCRRAVRQGKSADYGLHRARTAQAMENAHEERLTPKPEPIKKVW